VGYLTPRRPADTVFRASGHLTLSTRIIDALRSGWAEPAQPLIGYPAAWSRDSAER